MEPREVSWQNAFWSLPPLAINTMMQPSGRVCGFDSSLRTYLRSSPIVCVFDAVFIIIRFITYSFFGLSARAAAKKVIDARGREDGGREDGGGEEGSGEEGGREDRGGEDAKPGGFRSLERKLFLRYLVFCGKCTHAIGQAHGLFRFAMDTSMGLLLRGFLYRCGSNGQTRQVRC
jgi:hypothetical protein